MSVSRPRRVLKVAGWLVVLFAAGYALILLHFWTGRVEMNVQSAALSERRVVTLFNATSADASRPIIYSLDGEAIRHGLLPAANGAIIAWLHGYQAPTVVAIHTRQNRDVDLRPISVKPAYWRPNIKGRAPDFDVFLITEMRAAIEKRFGQPKKRYLMGHSLGGFYAIDMASRRSDHGFDGLFAFTPTFSHDMSLLKRLGSTCANSPILYANIGLESGRDTAVFQKAARVIAASSKCDGKVTLARHPGMIHSVAMVTGQIAAFFQIYSDR
jgi:predicted alpha/beta superfamily hydrolase